jgi:hypothetical protein
MLDPDLLLHKINDPGGLKDAHAKHAAEIPEGSRLPDDYFDRLSAEIVAEKDDPHRVARAATPPGPGGPPAPPPVIYLSRMPSVSQFMGVINDCFEQELQGSAAQGLLHLGNLDHLRAAVERLADELRSRFRKFGPCDIRFIEPKLAEVIAGFTGRHAFATDPVEVTLSDNAEVIVFGDWATALPQARNVAARIAEHVAAVDPAVDCHVIHLGDTYYSGLEDECRHRFLDLWPVKAGSRVKSWTLAGNHDMYSGGHGYFGVLLADPRFAAQKGCSYFALANDSWQILGLDSSYQNPDTPGLQPPQGAWLADRVTGSGARRTMLLTHHQPFSAYEQIGDTMAAAVNAALGDAKVDAWLWGHEHRCAVYKPDVVDQSVKYNATAGYTAIIGHGGVPQLLTAQDDALNPGAFAWEFKGDYTVGNDRWGLGGYAVLKFAGRELTITYYDEYGKDCHTDTLAG